MAHILFLLTSNAKLGDTGKITGFHYEEAAYPYVALKRAGHEITLGSVQGGAAPIDPSSLEDIQAKNPALVADFDGLSAKGYQATRAVNDLKATDFDAIYLPGGHGTMWDIGMDDGVGALVSDFYAQGKIVAAVCHGPAGLVKAKKPNGEPLVKGLRVNAFTDAEETHINYHTVMPYMLETRLREQGGVFEGSGVFHAHAVRDGLLITGQNPMSLKALTDLIKNAL